MKKRFAVLDSLLIYLVIICIVLGVALAIQKPAWIVPILFILFIAGVWLWVGIYRLRMITSKFLRNSEKKADENTALQLLQIPVLLLEKERVIWYNQNLLEHLLLGEEICFQPIQNILPTLDLQACKTPQGQQLYFRDRYYLVYGVESDSLVSLYFIDQTVSRYHEQEYQQTRPSVMLITIDTYDELLKEMKETERARIMGDVEHALETFIGTTTGFVRKIATAKYLAVVEERHMKEMIFTRFPILDTVRAIGSNSDQIIVTLSIGIGRMAHTLADGEKMAAQALDMALGRGGDQVAVKTEEGFTFYGGVSHSVEKRSKVRSRIISAAIRDLIMQSENVLVMGHRMSDLDALGAGIGMMRFAKICKKEVSIVLNKERTLAGSLVEEIEKSGLDPFLTPEQATSVLHKGTLLIIVDTHLPYLLESEELYRHANQVIVIDHHRKCVGHIENSIVFYHEPYASSTSELVTEILQYLEPEKQNRLTPLEAQALLSGIMLDTRNFSLHTGVRTFEAAAYLRRMGAQTQAVKKLFNSSLEDYTCKSQLVASAELYQGCAVVCAEEPMPEMDVVIPQAANDLLTINGVQASVVAVNTGTQISISARSMGEVNVQLIMEKLGGGGHLTMAGAQLKGVSIHDARTQIMQAIAEYWEEKKDKEKPKNSSIVSHT